MSEMTESNTTLSSSIDTSQSCLVVSQASASSPGPDEDEDDDELLALRIAALESIKLKEKKLSEQKATVLQNPPQVEPTAEAAKVKPAFVIRSHPKRSNLVSIITQEEEIERTLVQQQKLPTPPPPPSALPLKPSSPSTAGLLLYGRSPPRAASPYYYRSRSRSRSYERQRSPFSPRRWSPGPRRWSSRSPPPLRRSRSPPPRGRSPLLGRRSPPPLRRSPLRSRRSPLGRRSPLRRSPRSRSPYRKQQQQPPAEYAKSESEWETDTEPPTDTEEAEGKEPSETRPTEENKENLGIKENGEAPEKKETGDSGDKEAKVDDGDGSHDDVLKLDATAEVDEFSKFLNEFEDELRTEKKAAVPPAAAAAAPAVAAASAGGPAEDTANKAAKRSRPETERKVVDGKRLRKKVKAVKNRELTPSMSPEGGEAYHHRRQSPLRFDSFNRSPIRGSRVGGRSSADRRGPEVRTDRRLEPGRLERRPDERRLDERRTNERRADERRLDERRLDERRLDERRPDEKRPGDRWQEDRSSEGRRRDGGSQPTDRRSQESNVEPKESLEEREARESREYEERLARLSSPERQRLEARKKKFLNKGEVKADKPTKILLKSSNEEPSTGTTRRIEQVAKRRELERLESDEGLSLDISDTMDMFTEEPVKPAKAAPVTDLRVRLHKKMKMKEQQQPPAPPHHQQQELTSQGARERLKRARQTDQPQLGEEEEEEDMLGPVEPSNKRRVVPPGSSATRSEDDGSPSPPPRTRQSSGDTRRVLVVKESSVSVSPTAAEIRILTGSSPRKSGIKESLHLRLGDKLEPEPTGVAKEFEFTEDEILAEMIRQKEKREKRRRKEIRLLLREEKEERKKEGRKKEERKKEEKKKLKKKKKQRRRSGSLEESGGEEKAAAPAGDDPGSDSGEELFKYFEENHQPLTSSGEKRIVSKIRRSSGESGRVSRSSVRSSSPELTLGGRLGKKIKTEKTAKKKQSSLDVAGEESEVDILEKMKKKNARRLQRIKEIEEDRRLHS